MSMRVAPRNPSSVKQARFQLLLVLLAAARVLLVKYLLVALRLVVLVELDFSPTQIKRLV